MVKKQFKIKFSCGHEHITYDSTCVQCPTCKSPIRFGDKADYMGKIIKHTDEKRWSIINNLVEYCDNHNYHVDYYHGISEEGYDDKPMLCANWNPAEMDRIYNYLEKNMNDLIEFDWSDKWLGCSDCNKAVRTSPDSYSWEPSYIMTEYDLVCAECCKDDSNYIVDTLMNQFDQAGPSWAIPFIQEQGFICLYDMDGYCERFQTGLHAGMNDTPEKVIKLLEKEFNVDDLNDLCDYIFIIDTRSQFYCNWSIYLREI